MDIMQLVDELEAVISKSFRIPFTTNVIVNEDALFDIIDQMRVSIPREIKEARRTEAERERILARAREESERLINMAKDKMMSAVDDHEIIEAARRQARETIAQAEQEAEQLKADSRAYVVDNLSALEEHLLKLLTTVRNGLRQLEGGSPPPTRPHPRAPACRRRPPPSTLKPPERLPFSASRFALHPTCVYNCNVVSCPEGGSARVREIVPPAGTNPAI